MKARNVAAPYEVSRRHFLKAGTASAAFAASGVSSAEHPQPSQQTPRAKGPAVWLDLDQKALDDAYDQAVYAPNRDQILARFAYASELVRKRIGAPERHRYGDSEVEALDHRSRRARRREQSRPGIGLDSRHATLSERRHRRKLRHTLGTREPSARTEPDSICCPIRPGSGAMLMSIRSASNSVSMGERPLKGTCNMSMPALVLNSSPARWAPEPLPVDPNVRVPGLTFAIATTSPTLVSARLLRTTSTWGMAAMPATGAKSLTAS